MGENEKTKCELELPKYYSWPLRGARKNSDQEDYCWRQAFGATYSEPHEPDFQLVTLSSTLEKTFVEFCMKE
jgi:hypothetical protein